MASHSRMVLIINTNLPIGTLRDIAKDNPTRPHEFFRKLINFLKEFTNGSAAALVQSGVVDSGASDATASSALGTFTGSPSNGETIAINGVTITFVSSGSPTNNQVSLAGSPSNNTLATRLAAAINTSTSDGLSCVVQAVASGATVNVIALMPGVIGDSILLADSATNFAWANSAVALSGGWGSLPVLRTYSYGK